MDIEYIQECSQNSYMCRVCGQLLSPSKYDLCSNYGEEIQEYLLDKCVTQNSVNMEEDVPIRKQIPLTVNCINKHCDSKLDIIAAVDANCVLYTNELNVEDEIYVYELIDACVLEFCHNHHIGEVNLRIVCKTNVGGSAKCYIGYQEETRRLFRPVRSVYEFQWPNSLLEFHVGEVYKFKVLATKDNCMKFLADVPHQNEDIVVDESRITAYRRQHAWDPSVLEAIACSNIFHIFKKEHLKELKYIETNIVCPSVGVLCVSENNVRIFDKFDKKRVQIWNSGHVFDFPLTAVSFDRPVTGEARRALVILGLGRPYAGEPETFTPARCYVLVLGLYIY